MKRYLLLLPIVLLALPAAAKDSLGIFAAWGAFRDPNVPRCYAIAVPAEADDTRDYAPFASIGTWPRRNPAVRNQLHIRLSRAIAAGAAIRLSIGRQRFELTGGGGDAWAKDRQMDAAIIAAMRSGGEMAVSSLARSGRRFTDEYSLDGAATAMDAATVGCARLR